MCVRSSKKLTHNNELCNGGGWNGTREDKKPPVFELPFFSLEKSYKDIDLSW